MPRPLDSYRMDLSGLGQLIRGTPEEVVAPDGVKLGYKKRLFTQDPKFDANGQPIPDNSAGRQLIESLKLNNLAQSVANDSFQKREGVRGNEARLTDTNRIQTAGNENRTTAAQAHGFETSSPEYKTKQDAYNATMGVRPANAIAGVNADTAKALEAQRIAELNTAANIAEKNRLGIASLVAGNNLTQAHANATNIVGAAPSGSVQLDPVTGKIINAINPAGNKAALIPAGVGPDGKTLVPAHMESIPTPLSVRASVAGKYGEPGSVIPPTAETAPAPTTAPIVPANTPIDPKVAIDRLINSGLLNSFNNSAPRNTAPVAPIQQPKPFNYIEFLNSLGISPNNRLLEPRF